MTVPTRTQVVIIGSGPAGLMLGALLHKNGVDAVILEQRSRDYVEARIRAGILEQGTVNIMREIGVSQRLDAEGLTHDGIYLCLDGAIRQIDMHKLTGKNVTVYGQTEVTKDLINDRIAKNLPLVFEAANVTPHGFDTSSPSVSYVKDGVTHTIQCDAIAGCDGFHGVARQSVPQDKLHTFERVYPYGWLGILAEAPPPADELIYARSERGFALFSMRSKTRSRHYIQVAPDEDLALWPDAKVWDELRQRLGAEGHRLKTGEVIEKSVVPMRSFVAEPLRFGRLFLAGDAAHIVPPTGAKGLNLAASDVHYLTEALVGFLKGGDEGALAHYSQRALARIWKAQRFSWWMTSMLHNSLEPDGFDRKIRNSELAYVMSSDAAMTTLAEQYVGLPF